MKGEWRREEGSVWWLLEELMAGCQQRSQEVEGRRWEEGWS
jgi:hypothetical protein